MNPQSHSHTACMPTKSFVSLSLSPSSLSLSLSLSAYISHACTPKIAITLYFGRIRHSVGVRQKPSKNNNNFFLLSVVIFRSESIQEKVRPSSKSTRLPATYCLSNDVSLGCPSLYQVKWQEENENQPIYSYFFFASRTNWKIYVVRRGVDARLKFFLGV